MKRLVSLALSAALALSLLAGCGNSADPQTTERPLPVEMKAPAKQRTPLSGRSPATSTPWTSTWASSTSPTA